MVSWSAEEQQIDKTAGETQREPMYQGEPLSYWLRSIRDRDEKIDVLERMKWNDKNGRRRGCPL